MLIDTSYFFGDIQIGQLSEQSVQESLNFFISQYEPKILESLLGYATYKQIGNADQKWKDLKEGAEYTNETGILCKWNGLYDATSKVSLIAYYVYCQYMENELSVTGGAGEGKVQMQNAMIISNGRKIRKAWNMMVEQNCALYDFLNAKKDVYFEWDEWQSGIHGNALFQQANEFGI